MTHAESNEDRLIYRLRRGGIEEMDLRVVVVGAGGKMGREVVKAVHEAPDMELVGAVDPGCAGTDAGVLAGVGELGIETVADLEQALKEAKPTAIVDFTKPDTVYGNVLLAVEHEVHAVVGTTGLGQAEWQQIDDLARERGVGVIHSPNFAIGAILMMRFAQEAARLFDRVEIIELHHDQKHDAPSGTALYTAELIREVRQAAPATTVEEVELVEGARGGDAGGVHIHSVRLPGLVAHQEVILGLPGQTLTIRHDSINRESFMPGVLTALRRVSEVRGVLVGLEKLLFD